ncbi:MAG: multidrug ABC transporter permease/ATP-binding protein, partial [Psychrobacillus sp.]
MKVFLELGWYFKQRKKQYLFGVLMLLFVAFLQLFPPKIIGLVVDEIHAGTLTNEFLFKWLTILALAAIGMYVLRYYWRIMIF